MEQPIFTLGIRTIARAAEHVRAMADCLARGSATGRFRPEPTFGDRFGNDLNWSTSVFTPGRSFA